MLYLVNNIFTVFMLEKSFFSFYFPNSFEKDGAVVRNQIEIFAKKSSGEKCKITKNITEGEIEEDVFVLSAPYNEDEDVEEVHFKSTKLDPIQAKKQAFKYCENSNDASLVFSCE